MRSELSVLQHCVHHAGGDGVELGDGRADGGSAVLVVLLVPLGPDGAQAVVGDDLLKQQLERKDTEADGEYGRRCCESSADVAEFS